jgi:hypothetical protein
MSPTTSTRSFLVDLGSTLAQLSGSNDVAAQGKGKSARAKRDTEKGAKTCPVWVLDGFVEISASGLE